MLKFLIKGALALGAAGLLLEGFKRLSQPENSEPTPPIPPRPPHPAEDLPKNPPLPKDEDLPKKAPLPADEKVIEPLTTNSVGKEGLAINTVERQEVSASAVKAPIEPLTVNRIGKDGLSINTVERKGA